MSTEPIVVEACREEGDMQSAAWLVFWRSRMWLWFFLFAVVFGVLAWPQNGTVGAMAAMVLAFFFLMMTAAGFVIDRGGRAARVVAKADPMTHRFSLEGLEIDVATLGTAKWQWSSFVEAVDNDRVLLLRRANNYPIVLPKRDIGVHWPRLRGLLVLVLGERANLKKECVQ